MFYSNRIICLKLELLNDTDKMAAPMNQTNFTDSGQSNHDFCLEKHAKKLLFALNQNRISKNFCDGVVKIHNESIPVQRCVLAASSHYFKLAFERNISTQEEEESTACIDISTLGINTQTFMAILDYIYTSDIELLEENIQDILQAADLLLLLDLKSRCCEFLESCISSHNCLGILEFSQQYSCPWVHHKAETFLDENFGQIIHSDEFLQLPTERLKSLLQRDTLHVTSELQLLRAILLWTQVDINTREELMFDLVKECLRPRNICQEEFEEMIKAFHSEKDSSYRILTEYIMTASNGIVKPRGVENVVVFTGGRLSYAEQGKILSDVTCYVRKNNQLVYGTVDGYQENQPFKLPPMSVPRIGHGAVECGGCLYVVGGQTSGDQVLRSAEKYDPATNRWYEIAPMNQARQNFQLVAVDDKIYAIGGEYNSEILVSMEKYDIFRNEWEPCPDLKLGRLLACAAVVDKKIYVIGGRNKDTYYEVVECYNTRNEIWSSAPPMHERRWNARSIAVCGDIFVFGGYRPTLCPSNYGVLKFCQTEVFSTKSNKWSMKDQFPLPSDGMLGNTNHNYVHDAVHHGNEICLIGGFQRGANGGRCLQIRVLDLDTGTWLTEHIDRPPVGGYYACCSLTVPKDLLHNLAKN